MKKLGGVRGFDPSRAAMEILAAAEAEGTLQQKSLRPSRAVKKITSLDEERAEVLDGVYDELVRLEGHSRNGAAREVCLDLLMHIARESRQPHQFIN